MRGLLGSRCESVTSVMKLLSLLLSDAVDERLIAVNPIRARHRGRRRSDRRVERLWATPSQVLAVADNIARLPTAGAGAELLIVTAAWTGPDGARSPPCSAATPTSTTASSSSTRSSAP